MSRWASKEKRLLETQPSLAPKITFVILRTPFRIRSRRLLVYSSWSTACHQLILFRHVLITLLLSRVRILLMVIRTNLFQVAHFLMEPFRFGPRLLVPSLTVYKTLSMNSMHSQPLHSQTMGAWVVNMLVPLHGSRALLRRKLMISLLSTQTIKQTLTP